MKNFISASFDSKILPISGVSTAFGQSHLMNLRLYVMFHILFGHRLIIPQGWAIDSISFIKVAAEVIHATEGICRSSKLPEGIDRFSPFAMECHTESKNYASLLSSYLKRDDCHWSGMPTIRAESDGRKEFAALLDRNAHSHVSKDTFVNKSVRLLGSPMISEHWADVYNYFSMPKMDRFKKVEMPQGFYISNLRKSFSDIDNKKYDESISIADLRSFRKYLSFNEGLPTNTSHILDKAEQEMGPEACAAIKHMSTFSQIVSAAVVTGASAGSPAFDLESPDGAALGDTLIRNSFKASYSGEVDVFEGITLDKYLKDHLEKLEWKNIWENVVRLSLNPQWINLIQRMNIQVSSYDRKFMDGPTYRSMENLLSNECSDLVLERSGIESIGIQFNERTYKVMESLTDSAIAGSVAGLLIYPFGFAADITAAALTALVAPHLIGIAKPEIKRLGLNPFSRQGKFAKKISVFTPFKR